VDTISDPFKKKAITSRFTEFNRRTIALLMEAANTCETSVDFYQTTRRNNPEDNHHEISQNISSHKN
jgi:hypothetical protein